MDDDNEKKQKACLSKLTWQTRELAEAAAIYAVWQHGESGGALRAYLCRYCHKWHLARASN